MDFLRQLKSECDVRTAVETLWALPNEAGSEERAAGGAVGGVDAGMGAQERTTSKAATELCCQSMPGLSSGGASHGPGLAVPLAHASVPPAAKQISTASLCWDTQQNALITPKTHPIAAKPSEQHARVSHTSCVNTNMLGLPYPGADWLDCEIASATLPPLVSWVAMLDVT